MKKLILMRHAKSDRSDLSNDFERPLSERGLTEAPQMGILIEKENIIPDLIICSPAKRTRETLKLVTNEIKQKINIRFEDIIYENYYKDITDLIFRTSDDVDTLMIVGHNPSMEELSRYFTGLDYFYDKFVTSALLLINFDVNSWRETKETRGKPIFFKTPKGQYDKGAF